MPGIHARLYLIRPSFPFMNICILRGPTAGHLSPFQRTIGTSPSPYSDVWLFIFVWLFFLNIERIIRQTYVLQVRGLRLFILEFLVGRAWESLERAAHGSKVLHSDPWGDVG